MLNPLRRRLFAFFVLVAVGCAQSPAPRDGGLPPVTDAGTGPVDPELFLFPLSLELPPGGWGDVVVRCQAPLQDTVWSLSLEGVPTGISADLEHDEVSAARPGTVLHVEAGAVATPGATLTVRATRGAHSVLQALPLSVLGGGPDFSVHLSWPAVVAPSSAVVPRPGVDGALEGRVRVVSRGGFAGEVQLFVVGGPPDATVLPSSVNVAPGLAGEAVVRNPEGASLSVRALSGQVVHSDIGSVSFTGRNDEAVALDFSAPGRLWLRPGETLRSGGRLQPWRLSTPVVQVGAAPGLTLLGSVSSTGSWDLWVTAAAALDAGVLTFTTAASAGPLRRELITRVVVPGPPASLASGGAALVRAPLRSGRPGASSNPSFVRDSDGIEVRFFVDTTLLRARENNAFAPEVAGGLTDWHQTGVLGGRVVLGLSSGTLSIAELRADVGTRPWLPITGVAAVRPSVSYDAARELWVATRAEPSGAAQVWRRASNGTVASTSMGLPTSALDAGPWLAAGAGAPVLSFVKDAALQVARFENGLWVPVAPVPAATLPGALAGFAQDSQGRAVVGWSTAAGVRVHRLEGNTWTELGQLLGGPEAQVLEAVMRVDAVDRPVVLWVRQTPALPSSLDVAHVPMRRFSTRLSVYDGTRFLPPFELTQDAAARASGLALELVPGAPSYLGWLEEGELVVLRSSL